MPTIENHTDDNIFIYYDGLNDDGMAFSNACTSIDSVNRLAQVVLELQNKGYLNLSVEYNDETFWLSEYSVSEIENFIREDMLAEIENL